LIRAGDSLPDGVAKEFEVAIVGGERSALRWRCVSTAGSTASRWSTPPGTPIFQGCAH
jgi:hypothetical protein